MFVQLLIHENILSSMLMCQHFVFIFFNALSGDRLFIITHFEEKSTFLFVQEQRLLHIR